MNESQFAQIAITKEFFFCDLFLFTEVYFSHCYQICIHILQYIFGFYKYYFEALSYNPISKKYKENFLAIFVSALIFLWFFYWSDFFCRICCSLKKGRILTSKGPDHGWLCQQHTTWLQASRFPSCKFFVHNWVLYLWSFRERGKDLPEWHHRPNRPCCLACCCHGLQHGLGLESWSWIEKESLRLKRPRRPKSSSCWWINHLKTNDELL